jgi:hypothetical protein
MATKTELKKIAQYELMNEYGFFPKLADIRLLESDDKGQYIRFMVNAHEYRFDDFGGYKELEKLS